MLAITSAARYVSQVPFNEIFWYVSLWPVIDYDKSIMHNGCILLMEYLVFYRFCNAKENDLRYMPLNQIAYYYNIFFNRFTIILNDLHNFRYENRYCKTSG